MRIERDHRDAQRDADAAALDERIRRRFRTCETLPLFGERPARPSFGFFEPPHIGEQLRLRELFCDQRNGCDR